MTFLAHMLMNFVPTMKKFILKNLKKKLLTSFVDQSWLFWFMVYQNVQLNSKNVL
jgi:hypothetical protein